MRCLWTLALFSPCALAQCLIAPVLDVHDGDTFAVHARIVVVSEGAAGARNSRSSSRWLVSPRGATFPACKARLVRVLAEHGSQVRLCDIRMGATLRADVWIGGQPFAKIMHGCT